MSIPTHSTLFRAIRTASLIGVASTLGWATGACAKEQDIERPVDSFSAGSHIDELVVSVRRRDEDAQDVPIALSVVGAEALKSTGAYSLNEIQRLVPSLQVFSFNPRNTNINIRGLGSNVALTNDGLENGVGFYIDNVYYGRVGQSQFDLVDLQQIEVLRGPQGTLFGKNTTAGAINITSKAPSFTPEYFVEVTGGDYGRREARASLTGPLLDNTLAYRLTYAQTDRDGIIKNSFNGRDVADYSNVSFRGQLLYTPTEDIQLRVIGDYSAQDAECCLSPLVEFFGTYDNGAAIPNNFLDRVGRKGYTPQLGDPFDRKVDANSPFQANMNAWGGSAQLDWEIGGGKLTAISAYRGWDWNPANDADNTALSVFTVAQQQNRQRQFSQEIRFSSPEGDLFDYVVGAYYLWQRNEALANIEYGSDAANWFVPALPALVSDAALNGFGYETELAPEIDSYAVFGQTVWHLSENIDVTAGVRFNREKKTGEFDTYWVSGASLVGLPAPVAGAATAIRGNFNPQALAFETDLEDNAVSGLLSVSYDLSDNALAYATVSTGSKSGGLNLTVLPAGVEPEVAPEDVINFEVGVKSKLLDQRLTFNAAAFWTEISDYQSAITEVLANTTAIRQYIANAGKVRSRGVETDIVFQATDYLSFNASVAYDDATYEEYRNAQQKAENLNLGAVQDLSGERLTGAPEWTYTVGADASFPVNWGGRSLELYTSANYSYRSEFFTAVSNSRYSEVDAYGILTARLGLRAENARWDISLWAKNLTDEEYFQTRSPANTGLVTGVVGEPRYLGATLRFSL